MPLWRRVRRPQVAATGGRQCYQPDVPDYYPRHGRRPRFLPISVQSGGAWIYQCQGFDDNSTSQWAAIGLIGANRAFGITIPKFVTDGNQVWLGNSQNGNGTLDTKAPRPFGGRTPSLPRDWFN